MGNWNKLRMYQHFCHAWWYTMSCKSALHTCTQLWGITNHMTRVWWVGGTTSLSLSLSLSHLLTHSLSLSLSPSLTNTTTSSPALTRESSLFLSSSCVPMAAPTRSCFLSSFEARGKLRDFFKSVLAISATSSSFSLTIGSFPIIGEKNRKIGTDNLYQLVLTIHMCIHLLVALYVHTLLGNHCIYMYRSVKAHVEDFFSFTWIHVLYNITLCLSCSLRVFHWPPPIWLHTVPPPDLHEGSSTRNWDSIN